MRKAAIGLVVALTLVSAIVVAPRSAIASTISTEALLGTTVSGNTSVTGTTTINPLGALGSTVVGAGPEFSFCVGPNADNCASSGLFGSVDVADTAINFTFFGSTFGATGSFVVALTFLPPVIGGVTFAGGSLVNGSFGLTSFTPSTITFTGTPNGNYNAVGGSTISFNVSTVPEPGTLALLGLGLLGGSRMYRKRSTRREP